MNIKDLGQIFTPIYIVDFMLDELGYKGSKILNKKIIEPAAGNGNFVIQIFRRYFNELKKEGKITNAKVIEAISYIYAIEIDEFHYKNLLKNITNEIYKHIDKKIIEPKKLYKELKKNIWRKNTLELDSLNFCFDFIIGNPPYVRLHNIKKNNALFLRGKFFSMERGMVDLYYAFFEWGLNNLKEEGKLSFITPNNFMNNSSALNLRKILKNNIQSLYNFQSEIIFNNVTTYNLIIILKKNSTNIKAFLPKIRDNVIIKGEKKNFFYLKNDKIIIGNKKNVTTLKKNKKPNLNFKNGLATLADSIYITSNFQKINDKLFYFNGYKIETELIKKVIKISTFFSGVNNEKICIFPYKEVNKKIIPLSWKEMNNYPYAKKYFLLHKESLSSRSMDNSSEWFHFGRSQAIQSILYEKVVLKNIIKDKIEYSFIPKGTLVYSGLYSEYKTKNSVANFLSSKIFYSFVRQVGFDKRGGYKNITSNLLKELWFE